MQTTERIHPGGKQSQLQPPDEVSRYGRVNFRRQVFKTREQSQQEDAVGTTENIEAQEMNETEEEAVKGKLYVWASNICHLEDTKVNVEDLSDRDIDPRLAQNTQDLLSKILKCDAEEMQISAYCRSEQPGGLITEEFIIPGSLGEWRVCRKTYYDIDAREGPNSQYSTSTTAKRILAEAAAKAGPAPSDAQVKHVACRILAKDRGELLDKNNCVRWSKLLDLAHEELYNHRADAAFQSRLTHELSGTIKRPADQTPELVDLVGQNLPTGKGNEFHQFILDEEASTLCEHVEGFDIVILRDGKHELICGLVAEAVQKLFPAETVDKMSTAAEAFAWRFPYKKPDEFRHPTSQAVHLAAHPEKDVRSTECQQPHFAVCGVEHYGLHHENGHGSGFKGLCFQKFYTCRKPDLLESTAWKEEFPKLKGGVYGVAAKVSTLVLEAWDHKLYEAYLEVRQHLPEELKMTLATTGENPYGYMAQLVDTLTEGHTDVTDWMQGMAALTCFGNFTGKSLLVPFPPPDSHCILTAITGGDLVLKELGVRIAFPSGSNCHLRGQSLHHLISSYEGNRHSLVLTNKESVRKTIPSFDERLEEETERAVQLQSKDPKDWSDDEHKLHEAFTEGNGSMLEYAWNLIKDEVKEERAKALQKRREKAKRKEADHSKGDGPEEPLKKEAKTAQ